MKGTGIPFCLSSKSQTFTFCDFQREASSGISEKTADCAFLPRKQLFVIFFPRSLHIEAILQNVFPITIFKSDLAQLAKLQVDNQKVRIYLTRAEPF